MASKVSLFYRDALGSRWGGNIWFELTKLLPGNRGAFDMPRSGEFVLVRYRAFPLGSTGVRGWSITAVGKSFGSKWILGGGA